MLKNQNGITLVALVITIVILIILATISISFAINGGLFDQATKGGEMYANSAFVENAELQKVEEKVNQIFEDLDVFKDAADTGTTETTETSPTT